MSTKLCHLDLEYVTNLWSHALLADSLDQHPIWQLWRSKAHMIDNTENIIYHVNRHDACETVSMGQC